MIYIGGIYSTFIASKLKEVTIGQTYENNIPRYSMNLFVDYTGINF